MGSYYVYIMANDRNGTIYVGVTGRLVERIEEHKNKSIRSFTKKYGANKLVYFEEYEDVGLAIQREKNLKKWNREWKIRLIEKMNPYWRDLVEDFCGVW